ncbi:FAD-dependent monooxygenase [Nonomuraea angiospora]|uniref:2-polyprenyl-6-methoxyphenol hydroxylase-like FAD-dependent oxidoreductase n=1 Tax=Nonomuraea angiospora TaxID=46172 RepID=A0ABR9LZW7_9ACTN|nr:FAD-dependent monooxygenase [Nonomuraea angiospora]MBE1586192.1 2-polyprenyl-6-methoxyphenol hydroxylase-like FAD-dependent oxidoreductase [Nonomuraea angiospora]
MDILIIGGGPNGLMLACELALAGVRPTVVERLPRRSDQPKANGIVGQVVRLLHQRGLAARDAPMPGFVFGALPLDLAGLEDNPLYGMGIKQPALEELIERRAVELGVEIRRGHELLGFTQDPHGVSAELRGPEGAYELRTRYLVGCDGAHSTVRKLAGIAFPGVTSTDVVSRSAHVSVPGAVIRPGTVELEVPGLGTYVMYAWHRTERGAYAILPAGPGTLLVSAMEWDARAPGDDVPMTVGELRAGLARVLGADLPLAEPTGEGPHLLRRLNGRNTRVADRYREGRVFVVGDAAHVHSAMGAPGLNLGLQDAANLAWKLAAEVLGWAPPGLLDTYDAERRPAALRVAVHTQAQLALAAPGPEITALREVFGELLGDDGARRRIAAMMAGADLAYPVPAPAHPLAGRFLADLPAGPAARAWPMLLDGTGGLRVRHGRVHVVPFEGDGAVLVRPDGYVAWAGEPDETLDEALRTWFGEGLEVAA